MKQLLILSGKGGTGKTTTAAAFIQFSNAGAVSDCDVDAPNLHIVSPSAEKPEVSVFFGSDKADIDSAKCIGCAECANHCKFNAISEQEGIFSVNEYLCEGCGVCEYVCPSDAVMLKPDEAGELRLYKDSRVFSTAKLKMGRGNSGKLVTKVKSNMHKNAYPDTDLAIIDGSPGIGCPVIASVTGVSMVLVVAEPSLSGISDLKRILKTTRTLQTKTCVCVNKYDVNPEKTEEIIALCRQENIPFVGKIPYDKSASEAINKGKSIAQCNSSLKKDMYTVYENTMNFLNIL